MTKKVASNSMQMLKKSTLEALLLLLHARLGEMIRLMKRKRWRRMVMLLMSVVQLLRELYILAAGRTEIRRCWLRGWRNRHGWSSSVRYPVVWPSTRARSDNHAPQIVVAPGWGEMAGYV